MKGGLTVMMWYAMVLVMASVVHGISVAEKEMDAEFEKFKAVHKRTYGTKKEEALRREVFAKNMVQAAVLQARNPHARFGASPFADMTFEEFKVYHNGEKFYAAMRAMVGKNVTVLYGNDELFSGRVDWREKGAVTGVKNQGTCGSCWSFATTGNIEGQWYLAGHALVALSEQELVSCDDVDDACQGGLPDNAFEWLIKKRGGEIATEASYPYVSGEQVVPTCRIRGVTAGAKIDNYTDLPSDESQMATWMVKNGPIAIGVDATSWQMYTGGVLTDCTSNQMDHGVLTVGFDDNYSPPYWVIKNSWGATWGEAGYIRIGKGSNQCLVSDAPSTSIAAKGPLPPPSPTSPEPPTSAPSPTSPQPPAPTTTGSPFSTMVTQYQCLDELCMFDCTANTYPQDTCLPGDNGQSVIVQCQGDSLLLLIFETPDCSGVFEEASEPLNECDAAGDDSGAYVYTTCGSGDNAIGGSAGARVAWRLGSGRGASK